MQRFLETQRPLLARLCCAACRGSPTSQKVSFEQLRRGTSMDLGACLQMENRMVGG